MTEQSKTDPEETSGDGLQVVHQGVLEARLGIRLRSFIRRAAPLVRDQNGTATLTITLHQPAMDDDGTLFLEAMIQETLDLDGEEGRIPGVPFELEASG